MKKLLPASAEKILTITSTLTQVHYPYHNHILYYFGHHQHCNLFVSSLSFRFGSFCVFLLSFSLILVYFCLLFTSPNSQHLFTDHLFFIFSINHTDNMLAANHALLSSTNGTSTSNEPTAVTHQFPPLTLSDFDFLSAASAVSNQRPSYTMSDVPLLSEISTTTSSVDFLKPQNNSTSDSPVPSSVALINSTNSQVSDHQDASSFSDEQSIQIIMIF